jgi:hypothetical protein
MRMWSLVGRLKQQLHTTNDQHRLLVTADAPPPLSCLPDQLHAVQLADSIIGTAGLQEGELRLAAVTDSAGKGESSCLPPAKRKTRAAKNPFMKGFLDAKPRTDSKLNSNSSSKVRTRLQAGRHYGALNHSVKSTCPSIELQDPFYAGVHFL